MIYVISFGITNSFFDSGIAVLYTVQFILVPIQICQSVSHALTYGIYNKKSGKDFSIAIIVTQQKAKSLS